MPDLIIGTELSDLDKERLSPKRIIRAGMAIILLFVVGFGTWSVFAPLNAAVHAMGEVVFDSKRQVVQHLEGGIVKEILVKDGDAVEAGQPLIILVDEQIRPMVDLLEVQRLSEIAASARLEAEKAGKSAIDFPEEITALRHDPGVSRIMQSETRHFQARLATHNSQTEVLNSQIEQTHEESRGLREQLLAKKQEIASLNEQLEANAELFREGYVTRTHILELERLIAERIGQRESLASSIARNEQRFAELRERITSLKSSRIEEAAAQMQISSIKHLEIEERLRPARNSLERQTIRAPIGGRVTAMSVSTVGGTISPREPLMEIVPLSGNFILEGKIQVNDIADVQIGQPARVTLTAFKSSSTPSVDGVVTYVSANRLTERTAYGEMPYYAVHLDLDQKSMQEAGLPFLQPGMAADISIKTAPRTALQYFIGPLADRMGKAFHEK